MKITAGVLEYAAWLSENEADMAAMSDSFNAMGHQVYYDVEKVRERA